MAMTNYERYSRSKSSIMFSLSVIFTIMIIALLGLVTGYLISVGYSSLNLNFFTKDLIAVGPDAPGGMRSGIVGTLILVAMASVVGIPVGLLAGIYLAEYSSNSYLANPVRFVADVLAGVPSIVVGILGYTLLARNGFNAYAGALALSFIMIPLVTRTTEEMLLLVPRSYREASVALGATKARTILKVVMPAAAGSLITGIMLSIARVAGETAPLLFTALNFDSLTYDLNKQFPSLTVQIYNAATVVDPKRNGVARAGILVLLALIFALNLLVRFTAKAVTRSRK